MFSLLFSNALGHLPSDCCLTLVLSPTGRPCLVLCRPHSALYAQSQFCGRDFCHQPAVSPWKPLPLPQAPLHWALSPNPFWGRFFSTFASVLPLACTSCPLPSIHVPASCRRESGSGACLDLQVIDTVRSGRDREDAVMHHLLCGGLYKPRRRVRAGRT